MRVSVDQSRCQGHTLCNMAAPTIFMLRAEDGHADAKEVEVPSDLEATVMMAELGCPEQAVVLHDT
jgi:ferredoxin